MDQLVLNRDYPIKELKERVSQALFKEGLNDFLIFQSKNKEVFFITTSKIFYDYNPPGFKCINGQFELFLSKGRK